MKSSLLMILFLVPLFGFAQEEPFEFWVQQADPPDAPQPPEPFDVPAPPPNTFMFISEYASQPEEVVKSAPYSAEAVTEVTQYLADGNRIYRKNSTKLYRDSEGRTRREHVMDHLGRWDSAGKAPVTVAIYDPVSKEHYILDLEEQTAHKVSGGVAPMPPRNRMMRHMSPPPVAPVAPVPATPVVPAVPAAPATPAAPPALPHAPKRVMIHAAPGGAGMTELELPGFAGEVKKESLGSKVIDGVKTEGTRTLSIIEAGKIGNDRPIEIVSEKWYSPELKLTIATRHTDPRFGETVYTLTKIKRTEPDAGLFKVPANFKVVSD